jgi:hypothetical protein
MKKLIALSLFLFASVAEATTTHRCAQDEIVLHESAGVLRISIERFGDLGVHSTGKLTIYANLREAWYLPAGTFSLPFAPGQTLSSMEIPIENDYYDGTQRTIATCSGSIDGVPQQAGETRMSILVTDDEPLPTLTVAPFVEVWESDAGQVLEIPMSISPAFGHFGRINVATSNITTSNNDYHLSGFGEVDFLDRETHRSIFLTITGDQEPEQDEELFLRLSGDTAAKSVRVRINDDDRPPYTLELDRAGYAFDESSAGLVTIARGGLKSTAFTATLRIRGSEGHAQWPADVPIAFASGEVTKSVALDLNDGWYTGDRTGTIEVVTAGFLADSAELSVADDDPQPLLSIAGGEVLEGAAGQTTKLQATVTLSAPLGFDLQATVSSTPGTANADDYVRVDTKVFFAPGQLSLNVPIDIRGDAAPEVDETFTITVKSSSPSLAPVGIGSAIATIRDDDRPAGSGSHRFDAPATIEVSESQKWLVATIVRNGDTKTPSVATAKLFPGFGRTNATIEVRFAAHETRRDARFYIDDPYYSGNGEGRLELSTGGAEEDVRIVKIADDETRPMISIANLDVTEGATDRAAAFTIHIAPPSFRAIDVVVHATAGDHKNLPERITIPPFFTSYALPVTIVGDAVSEPVETFDTELTLPPDSPALRGDAVATCTIHDDDRGARLAFASDRIQHGATVTMTLELSAPSATAEALQVSELGAPLLALPPSALVPAGASSVTFDVVGLRVGQTTLRVAFGSLTLDTPLLVYGAAVPSVTPPEVRVPRGGAAMVTLALLPPADEEIRATVTSLDPAIAGVDSPVVITPGAVATFFVYGATIGQTSISITLPAEYGGTTLLVPVEVVDAAGRQRASRH